MTQKPTDLEMMFIAAFNGMAANTHRVAVDHGWFPQPGDMEPDRTFGELIALCHSELSEALEEYRKGRQYDETYTRAIDGKPEGIPSELADVIIRIMDMAQALGIPVAGAIVAKNRYNNTRPYRHGGKKI